MAKVYQAPYFTERKYLGPTTPTESCDTVAVRSEFSLSAALVVNDLIEMLVLPANCVPVDMIVDSDDLDSAGPAIALDVGIMAGNPNDTTLANRTTGAEFLSASTVAQAGGVVRPTLATAFRIAPTAADRSIGIKVGTAPTTGATTGKIGITLLYRPARDGA